jgi:hypothetical protein
MRSRSPVSPIRPMSPPLSASPPGSATSHHQALTNSPHLVSPMGYTHAPLADTSPAGLGFHYQLPFTGTPLSTHAQGQGPGLGMVSVFPYPTSAMGGGQSPPLGGKASRPRMSRGPTTRTGRRSTVAPASIGNSSHNIGGGEDEDSDFEDGDDGPTNGLGFSPTMQYVLDSFPIIAKQY